MTISLYERIDGSDGLHVRSEHKLLTSFSRDEIARYIGIGAPAHLAHALDLLDLFPELSPVIELGVITDQTDEIDVRIDYPAIGEDGASYFVCTAEIE